MTLHQTRAAQNLGALIEQHKADIIAVEGHAVNPHQFVARVMMIVGLTQVVQIATPVELVEAGQETAA